MTDPAVTSANRTPSESAQQLLNAYRKGEPAEPWLDSLASLDTGALTRVREERPAALAFWLNCYNAGTQRLLKERPGLYDSPLRVIRFFHTSAITVAGTALPLDRVEHGILRGGRSKYGFGYLPKLYVTRFERSYRLSECDPRIHFALNCGAESCPAIRFYEPARVDEQLDQATRSYLESNVEYDFGAGVVGLPRVFLWYRGDFGGRSGSRAFLRRYDVIPENAAPKVRYHSWDWTRAADKFAREEAP